MGGRGLAIAVGATARDVNAPGRAVAASAGAPWLTVARIASLRLANVWCCTCAAMAGVWRSPAKRISSAFGRALAPPGPL